MSTEPRLQNRAANLEPRTANAKRRTPNPEPRTPTYLGLFFVALSTLMYEILLTRIFSVTMLYHFAFVAMSLAMFGMTAGALVVYLAPDVFTAGPPARRSWRWRPSRFRSRWC